MWQYLREAGLEERISVISGTSVGVLNAVLMEVSDLQVGRHIWTTQVDGRILDFDPAFVFFLKKIDVKL